MPINDEPPRGKRKPEGPPDLDELWRKLNDRLNNLTGAPKGQNQNPKKRLLGNSLGILTTVLVGGWLSSGFYIVDASERGVVLRFGKYVETTDPGPRWHLPYPFETKEIVNISQVRTVEVGYRNNVKSKVAKESLMLTDDENIIDLQFAVQYIIKDARAYLFNNRTPDETVLQAAETATREIVGKNTMNRVLYEGREQIASDAAKLMQEILDRYKTGIQISKVTMQNAQPPEQVQAAFDDAVKAGQDRERQKNEGQAYANDVIPKARGLASRLQEEANGYQQRIIAQAEGDANRFRQVLTEYSKAPQVTRERLYLETMQQIFSNTSKVVVDSKQGSNLLYLPLDKLLQQNAAPAPANNTPSTVETPRSDANSPAASTEASNSLARSRDAFRNREREERP